MSTKSDLRARIVAARRFHDGAVRTLDAKWKALLAELEDLPAADRDAAIAAAADDLAPVLAGIADTDPEDDARGFVRRRMRERG